MSPYILSLYSRKGDLPMQKFTFDSTSWGHTQTEITYKIIRTQQPKRKQVIVHFNDIKSTKNLPFQQVEATTQ